MPSLNKVQVIGHVGKDPEQFGEGHKAVTKFSVASSERWTSKQGEKQERTEWFNVVAFGKVGDAAKQYCRKGSLVYVEGKQQTRDYTAKDGTKGRSTELLANLVFNLDKREKSGPEEHTQEATTEDSPW